MESEHLGMSTIAVLHLLDRRKNKKDKDIDKKLIKAVITERILNNNIPKLATCDASLYNGVAGYLYALLCIDKGLAEYQEEEEAEELIRTTIKDIVMAMKAKLCKKADFIMTINSETKMAYANVTKSMIMKKKNYFNVVDCLKGDLSVSNGVVGVLYMLIKAVLVVKELKTDIELMLGLQTAVK
jgi:lantibiotic modifying enzyme